jgi:hypothetical protein
MQLMRVDWRALVVLLALAAVWLAITLTSQWQAGPPRPSELVPAEEGSNEPLPQR